MLKGHLFNNKAEKNPIEVSGMYDFQREKRKEKGKQKKMSRKSNKNFTLTLKIANCKIL